MSIYLFNTNNYITQWSTVLFGYINYIMGSSTFMTYYATIYYESYIHVGRIKEHVVIRVSYVVEALGYVGGYVGHVGGYVGHVGRGLVCVGSHTDDVGSIVN